MFDGPWWPRATGAGTGQVTARAKRGTIYLGVNVYWLKQIQRNLLQHQITQYIISQVRLKPNPTTIQKSELSTNTLRHNDASPKFDSRFHYCGDIGLLKFLDKNTRLDIVYATHQRAQLSRYQRDLHGTAVENLVKSLAATKNVRFILDPENLKLGSLCGLRFQWKMA